MEEQRQVTVSCQNKPVNFPAENRIVVEWQGADSMSQSIRSQELIIELALPAVLYYLDDHYKFNGILFKPVLL